MSENTGYTDSRRTVSRRRALQALGAGALTVGGFSGTVLASGGGSDDTVLMTVVERSDGARIKKEVPADWYYYEEHVDEVAERFREIHRQTPGVNAVGIGSWTKTVAGRSAGHLRVYLDPDEATPDLPKSFKNVPVVTTDYYQAVRRSCNCNKGDYSIMPGAVKIESDSDGVPYGTATCEVEWGGNYYMLTASHIFTCEMPTSKRTKHTRAGESSAP